MAASSLCSHRRCLFDSDALSLLARPRAATAPGNHGIPSAGIVPVDCGRRYDLLFCRLGEVRMKKDRPKSPGKRRSSVLPGVRIAAVMLGVPLLVLFYQAHHSGLSMAQVFEHIFKGARRADKEEGPAKIAHGGKIDFLTPMPIGFPSIDPPRIGSLEIVDLDKDGLPDILVADMLANRVGWIRQYPAGVYTEYWISPVLPAPAHVSAVDIDGDGDLD